MGVAIYEETSKKRVRNLRHKEIEFIRGKHFSYLNTIEGGLIAEFLFEQNAIDTKGNYELILQGSPIYVTGANGYGMYFSTNNDSSYVSNSELCEYFIKNNHYAVSLWVKAATNSEIFKVTYDSQKGTHCAGIAIWESSVEGIRQGTSLYKSKSMFGAWHHVVISYDGNNFNLYVDCEKTSMFDNRYINRNDLVRIWIKVGNSDITNVNVAIDQVRIYNRELTDDEVVLLYNEPNYGNGTAPLPNNVTANKWERINI